MDVNGEQHLVVFSIKYSINIFIKKKNKDTISLKLNLLQ